jgi:hypothetical protein
MVKIHTDTNCIGNLASAGWGIKNYEVGGMWKEPIIAYLIQHPRIYLEGLKQTLIFASYVSICIRDYSYYCLRNILDVSSSAIGSEPEYSHLGLTWFSSVSPD